MKDLAAVFKALSDETRLRIITLLGTGELCVCDIVAALDIVQPKASFHLGVLKDAALIKDRKQGKWIHYSLNESDLFKRMLMVSVCERSDSGFRAEDRKRLERFLKAKKSSLGRETKKGKTGLGGA
jgi:ArsR family transcriptional regulator